LEDEDDVGREVAVRLAAEVGNVDSDAASGFEYTPTLCKDVT